MEDYTTYKGAESNNKEVPLYIYDEGVFNVKLTDEEKNILATYMIVEWIGYQLARNTQGRNPAHYLSN